jgi:peptide/nickel transport system substrate-binding protein
MGVFDLKRFAGIACALVLLASGCTKVGGGGVGGRQNAWTRPHVLIYADAGDINTLNPMFAQSLYVGYIAELTMAWLIKWDEHNRPYPELATEIPTKANGGISKDGRTITYHLRKSVKWSDGAPFTADDVVFSIKAVLNPANDVTGRQGWDLIKSVDEPNKYTVVIHLTKPYSPFIETFFSTAGANPCILPAHLLAKYPNINHVPYNAKPVGIGPFKVERWDRAQDVILVANPLYWRGEPKLHKIIYKIIPDRNTLLAQLQAHEVDMWALVPGNYLQRVSAIPGFHILRQPSYLWNHLDFDLQRPILKDLAVRKAMLYALDRQQLIDKIAHGVGTVADTLTPPNAPYAVTEPTRPFDLARARALLDADGWKMGPGGVRVKDGRRLSLDFAVNTGSQDVDDQIELMRADWKKVGIQINVHHYPIGLFFAPAQQGGIVYGNKWDLIVFAWENEAIGDFSQLYGCDVFPPNGQNDVRWCDPVAWAAMKALYAHYTQAERNRDVKIVMDRFYKAIPSIVLARREDIYAYNSDLKNFHPNGVSLFDNFMNVDI